MYQFSLTPADLDIGARTVWAEARSDGIEGMAAVAFVICNRVMSKKWWGNSIMSVCQFPKQFSCWNADDPNLPKLKALDMNSPEYLKAFGALAAVLIQSKDTTGGATHYHTRDISAYWSSGHKPCAEIGDHLFYNDIE